MNPDFPEELVVLDMSEVSTKFKDFGGPSKPSGGGGLPIPQKTKINIDLDDGLLSYTSNSPKRVFLFDGLIPMDTVSVIAGLGGGGKTQAVIQMISAAAVGESYANRSSNPTCSLLLGFEDSKDEINARFSATMAQFSPEKRLQAEKNIRALSLIGIEFQLVELKGRSAQATGYSDLLISKMLELKALAGIERGMLVIDHARLIAMIDWNDAAQVTVLTRELHRIAFEARVAVVLIAHSPKAAGGPKHEMSQADVAGSSALVDNARYVLIVKGMAEDECKSHGVSKDSRNNYVGVVCVKSNYSVSGRIGWFIKTPCTNHHVATHEYIDLHKPIISRVGDTSQEAKIIKYVRTHPNLTPTALRARSGKHTELGLSDLVVQSTIKDLLEKEMLVYAPHSDGSAKKITGNYKGVLVIPDGI